MIVALIAAAEIGFWVLLAAGLTVRYVLRMPRTGLALLLCEPLLEIGLLIATALDLKNGAEPNWTHGLAALYLGYTVGHGHRTVKWLDGHAAHRFGGAPAPPRPPRYGMARARHEGRRWLGTLIATVVATVLLQLAIWYVDDPSRITSLEDSRTTAWRVAGIHGVYALSYLLWPRRARADAGEPEEAAGADARR
ncbi:hypothetical protein SZN_22946 [Streptomyces zinciresistens K42]|uniref:Uncharacterized protein n=1 Tax=Streptomyces zinciresistens K42 TaxID=700597 RepID=G2GGF5_9ACTN|nr:hypothetical protein [Streptomyces zinciresistens]EGX57393.1 hypothetical protein SZN_22946 [Streptomyces zinciresistens K42]